MSDGERSVVVVDAVRTPVGVRNGGLAGWHAADLVAELLQALVRRHSFDPAVVDEVILGCASPVGDQGCNVARNAVLAAGWPESVPATTVDVQGASSLRALSLAADSIQAGSTQVMVAGGVEVSTTTPAGSWVTPVTRPFGPEVVARYAALGGLVPPGVAAEALAERRGLSRKELDAWAGESRRRAGERLSELGRDSSIVAVEARGWDRERRQVVAGGGAVVSDDELVTTGPGRAASPAGRPLFVPGGRITAANSAGAGDGAAAVLLMAAGRATELALDPVARVVAGAVAGVDPITMLTGAVPATVTVLARAGLGVVDVDRFEVDETFAAVTLDWMAALDADPARVNVDGGALARGQAGGAAGAAMFVALVDGLRRSGGGLGLAALGGVGGTGAAVLIEVVGDGSGTMS